MSAKKNNAKGPNILSVSLRLMLIVLFCASAFAVYRLAGAEQPRLPVLIGTYALLGCAAIVLLQLIVWGLIWVRHERVSELGLHIVRFAVILTAISLCVFVLLSADYAELYSNTHANELRQNVMTGSIYIQEAVGEGVVDDPQYFAGVAKAVESLLLVNDDNSARHICLYLATDAQSTGSSGFMRTDSGYLGFSSNAGFGCIAEAEVLQKVMTTFSAEYKDDITAGTYSMLAAYSPVFSVNGEPIGVLEICEIRQAGANLFRFASLELCLKLLCVIAFFSFTFYGCMQLVDIVLRPKNFDRSRRVLSCGRESARPILFFITLSAALPVMMLLFADNIRSLMDVYEIPLGIGEYIPFIVYLAGIAIGQIFGRGHRRTLSEIPADAGLLFSFLCNLALCLFMDWKKLAGLGLADNVIFMLVLFFVCGLGYGIAYRITAKFQAQSDALFGYDKYVYLCSCLGAISGIVFGAVLIENYSNVTLRIISCLLTAFTAVIAIILLEDLKSTVEIDESCKDTLTSYAGAVAGLIPVGLALCYVWIYLTNYMYQNGISIAAIGFCAAAPIIAFCFGNRLRLKKRPAQRSAVVISSLLSALAFVPMTLQQSFHSGVLSSLIVCVAVIFAASGMYSTTRHGELKKLTFRAMPLLFVGILLAVIAGSFDNVLAVLISSISACVLFTIIFLVSKYPSRPIIKEALPALTDGQKQPERAADVPIVVPVRPIKREDEPEKKKPESDEDKKPFVFVAPDLTPAEKKPETKEKAEEKTEDKQNEKPAEKPAAPIYVNQENKPADKPAEKADEAKPDEKPSEVKTEEKPDKKEDDSQAPIIIAAPAPAKTDEQPKKEAAPEKAAETQAEDEPLPIIFPDKDDTPESAASANAAENAAQPSVQTAPPAPEKAPEKADNSAPSETAAPAAENEPIAMPAAAPAAPQQQKTDEQPKAPEAPAAPTQQPLPDDLTLEDETAALLARAAAAKRAKERWQRYNEGVGGSDKK